MYGFYKSKLYFFNFHISYFLGGTWPQCPPLWLHTWTERIYINVSVYPFDPLFSNNTIICVLPEILVMNSSAVAVFESRLVPFTVEQNYIFTAFLMWRIQNCCCILIELYSFLKSHRSTQRQTCKWNCTFPIPHISKLPVYSVSMLASRANVFSYFSAAIS